jgi:DNA-binding MarR family transcriptional regulator
MKISLAQQIRAVQRCYPQIYIACHKTHIRATSTSYRLSSQDSSILVHLDSPTSVTPRQLAVHLGVKPSTLSASIKRLQKLGYLERILDAQDRRSCFLKLTPRGAEATSATSVLDPERVEKLLKILSPIQRADALRGLQLLADASLQLSAKIKREHAS